jgi:hypothetical protein
LLLLQQRQRTPCEEVERVAVGVSVADTERRVLVPYQRALLENVAQGVVATIREPGSAQNLSQRVNERIYRFAPSFP